MLLDTHDTVIASSSLPEVGTSLFTWFDDSGMSLSRRSIAQLASFTFPT
jgi:hypothetical protein